MLISEFVNEYNSIKVDTGKDIFVKGHIKRTYVPIGEKNAMAVIALDKSIVNDANGISYVDMIANKINFVYGIVRLYTDLEADKIVKDDSTEVIDVIKIYDLLCEFGLVNVICSYIPERELLEFTTVNENVIDAWTQKNMTTQAFVLKMLDRVTQTISEVAATLPTLLENPEIKEMLSGINLDEIKEKIIIPNKEELGN